jgi:hypothetical protein
VLFCCQDLKGQKLFKFKKEYGGAENHISVKFFHQSCHRQVNQIKAG